MSTVKVERGSRLAVAQIEADISDRRGLKWEWNAIDEDIRDEIRAAWASIIAQAIAAAVQRVREECAREVDAMAGDMAALDEASADEADATHEPDPSFPYDKRSFLMGRAMGYEVAEREARALAERMRGQGGG